MLRRRPRRHRRNQIRRCEEDKEDIDEIEYDVAKKSVSSIGWDNLRKKKKLYFLSCFFNIIRKYPTATTRIKQQRRPITQQSTRKLLSSSLFFSSYSYQAKNARNHRSRWYCVRGTCFKNYTGLQQEHDLINE